MADLLPHGDITKPRAILVTLMTESLPKTEGDPPEYFTLNYEEAHAVLALVKRMRLGGLASATLFITGSEVKCGACEGRAGRGEDFHSEDGGCGARFVRVSTYYEDINGLYARISAARPDLPFHKWTACPDRSRS